MGIDLCNEANIFSTPHNRTGVSIALRFNKNSIANVFTVNRFLQNDKSNKELIYVYRYNLTNNNKEFHYL